MNRIKILFILVLTSLFLLSSSHEANAANDSMNEFDSKRQFQSFPDFLVKFVGNLIDCFDSSMLIFNASQLNQTCIPRIITYGEFEKDCDGSANDMIRAFSLDTANIIAGLVIAIPVIITLFMSGIGAAIAVGLLIALLINFEGFVYTCFGSYILAPHEYVNEVFGYVDCAGGNENVHKDRLTQNDVPFFYSCRTEPVPQIDINKDNFKTEVQPILDKHYGNMTGSSSPYCQNGNDKYSVEKLPVKYGGIQPGSIIIRRLADFADIWKHEPCKTDNHKAYILTRDHVFHGHTIKDFTSFFISKSDVTGFYRLSSGKVQLCAAFQGMLYLLRIGCTYVAPPIEQIYIDAPYTKETRCSYFLSTRSDLHSLGRSISQDRDAAPVSLFLQSDFHIVSNVVGCIQDLLTKIVVGLDESGYEKSLLSTVQEFMKKIVRIVLVLYVALVGIKIMSSPQEPRASEFIVYLMKFALVVVLSGAVGNKIWYDPSQNNGEGLYTDLMSAMMKMSNTVLQSTSDIAPVQMCYYDFDKSGMNILSERDIQAGNGGILVATQYPNNQKGFIRLTFWDYVDCKLVNYLNLNSCKYTMQGIIAFWIGSCAFWQFTTFLITIVALIYSFILFLTIARFAHLTIVSMFALTILVLVSPIMSCFILFEWTKGFFDQWFKMILGYVLYPAFIFAFLALMITTFDSIFYGEPYDKHCNGTNKCEALQICGTERSNNDSLYCAFARLTHTGKTGLMGVKGDLCDLSHNKIYNAIVESDDQKLADVKIFEYEKITEAAFTELWPQMLKMLLFVILFYFLTSSVLQFLETLLGVYGVSSNAPDYVAKALSKSGGK